VTINFPQATSVKEVIGTLDNIIDWAVDTSHPLGCFTCLHRRTDVLIQRELDSGGFKSPQAPSTR
jgi:hypothetical protein